MNISESTLTAHPSVYPYLITRIVPTLYHLTILPERRKNLLVCLAMTQELINDINTCLVLDAETAVYINNRKVTESKDVPKGGIIVSKQLLPCFDRQECLKKDPSFASRSEALSHFEKGQNKIGFLMGDLTKGGVDATNEWLDVFGDQSLHHKGIPQGLYLCPKCNEYRGFCLDSNSNFKGKMMTVSCFCDNHNNCARCLRPLHTRKLNANYYDQKDGQIWHVPGFSGLSHVCGDLAVESSIQINEQESSRG